MAVIVGQLLAGLDYSHSCGVVQGHIQPEDILFESPSLSSRVRVTNCGRMMLFQQTSRLASRADSVLASLTSQLHFMAPETLANGLITAATDVWSCGVVCYMLLTGDLPFNGRSQDQLIASIQEGKIDFTGRVEPDNVGKVWTAISPEAVTLISSMLEVQPEARVTAKSALGSGWIQQALSGAANETGKPLALGTLSKLKAQSQLRKAVLSYATAQELQRHEDDRVRELFAMFDSNHDGYVSAADVTMGYNALHGDVNRAQIQTTKIMLAIPETSKGLVTCSDFLVAHLKLRQAEQHRRLLEAFNRAVKVHL